MQLDLQYPVDDSLLQERKKTPWADALYLALPLNL